MRHHVLLYTEKLKIAENLNSIDDVGFDFKIVTDASLLFDIDSSKECMVLFDLDSFKDDFSDFFNYLKKDIPDIKMMLLTAQPDVLKGVEYLKEGIKAYGNSYMHPIHIQQAVAMVCEGNIWIYPELASYMIQQTPVTSSSIEALADMDEREKEIITFVCEGMRNRDIATMLSLSEISVKKALTLIYQKLHVSDRVEMIAYFNR